MTTTLEQEAPAIELRKVCFGYGRGSERHEVLRDASLRVAHNEFVAIMGVSGSGKSTLMGLLAGLLTPASGDVLFAGNSRSRPGPDRGIVFQNYSLLPWLTVWGNVELAVKQVFPELSAAARRRRVEGAIAQVSLTGSEWKRPRELSGGMRQRVALARTLSMAPQTLLLDEPLSALDALTRAVLQDEILRLWSGDRQTVVMVTNDIDEALLMADRIVPLSKGPSARFERSILVDLPRPRDREGLNFDPDFKRLRNHLTRRLLELEGDAPRRRSVGRPLVHHVPQHGGRRVR